MNVRVKRGTETFFVPVDRSTAFFTLKQTLADIISDANTSVKCERLHVGARDVLKIIDE